VRRICPERIASGCVAAQVAVPAGTATVGLASATTQVLDFAGRPPKGVGVKVTDEGDGAQKLVDYLAAQKIV
jgi:electron transfer flavoprotein beta subunit